MLHSSATPRPALVLEALIGTGRHGRVFRATEGRAPSARSVAVKVPSTAGALRREVVALNRFQHPNIVRQVGSSPGALVIELAEDGTLQHHLDQRRKLSAQEVSGVVIGLAAALDHIHTQGWIHGDVNPTNIGVRTDGSVFLIDLATARPADGTVLTESTPAYSGPAPRADPHVDLRAAAVTALKCIDVNDAETATLSTHLTRIVRDIDAGTRVTVVELRSSVTETNACAIRPLGLTARPGSGSTAGFGPRPGPGGAPPPEQEPRARVVALALVVMAIAGVGLVALSPSSEPVTEATFTSARMMSDTVTPAIESLSGHAARWDSRTGTAIVGRGIERRWRVGRAGDLAAIGDWDCDGEATLGVYRPATSEWFAFSSWIEGTDSADAVVLDGGTRLAVRGTGAGCDEPTLID